MSQPAMPAQYCAQASPAPKGFCSGLVRSQEPVVIACVPHSLQCGGASTPRLLSSQPQMLVHRIPSSPKVPYHEQHRSSFGTSTPRSTTSWSPDVPVATWTAVPTTQNALGQATPRGETQDNARRTATQTKFRILPSSRLAGNNERSASPGSRSTSPSRQGGRAVSRMFSQQSTLNRLTSAVVRSASVGAVSAAVSRQASTVIRTSNETSPVSVATSPTPSCESPGQRETSLRDENDDLRVENASLRGQLDKTHTTINLLRKQLDDMIASRDREKLKAESLQNVARELQRRLDSEIAKSSVLQDTISNAMNGHTNSVVPGPHRGKPPSNSGRPMNAKAVNQLGGRCCGGGPSMRKSIGHTGHADKASLADEHTKRHDLQQNENKFTRPKLRPKSSTGPQRLTSSSRSSERELGKDDEGHEDEEQMPSMQQWDEEQQHDSPRAWDYVVQGEYDRCSSGNLDFMPKQVSCFPEDALSNAKSKGVAFVCSRGRRADSSVPNQDDFVIARHSLANDGHIALYGVFDGHGPAGHHCAAYARCLLPQNLFGQRSLIDEPEEALRLAFAHVQETLLEQWFDTETSGTTATLALVLHLPEALADLQAETWVYIAHVGDSRAVLVSRTEDDAAGISLNALTQDHRPDDPDEAERIHQEGGEVRRLHPGSSALRVFAQGCQWPALALTRSLGAAIATSCGVISEPEIATLRLTPGAEELLILGTDGLFEVCDSHEVATRLSKEGVVDEALEDVCTAARRRWARKSCNDTIDDITVIAIALDQSIGTGRTSDDPES